MQNIIIEILEPQFQNICYNLCFIFFFLFRNNAPLAGNGDIDFYAFYDFCILFVCRFVIVVTKLFSDVMVFCTNRFTEI